MNIETRRVEPYKTSKIFFSSGYLISLVATCAILLWGFKWTLLGLYWIPVVMNLCVYTVVVLFWFFYNFVWVRTALYLPFTILVVANAYKDIGTVLPWWKIVYIAVCKANKVRGEDKRIKRSDDFVRVLAVTYTKIAICLNFKTGEARNMSTAVFLHTKRKIISLHKAILPYMAPSFFIILVLTPVLVFLSSYNYRLIIEKLVDTPPLFTFGMYLLTLPFKFIWIFLVLMIVMSNLFAPLVLLPASKLFAQYVQENKIPVTIEKEHTLSMEAFMSVFMIFVSLSFYISVLINI